MHADFCYREGISCFVFSFVLHESTFSNSFIKISYLFDDFLLPYAINGFRWSFYKKIVFFLFAFSPWESEQLAIVSNLEKNEDWLGFTHNFFLATWDGNVRLYTEILVRLCSSFIFSFKQVIATATFIYYMPLTVSTALVDLI